MAEQKEQGRLFIGIAALLGISALVFVFSGGDPTEPSPADGEPQTEQSVGGLPPAGKDSDSGSVGASSTPPISREIERPSGPEALRLQGLVVDDRDGSPIGGAEVRLSYRAADDFAPVAGSGDSDIDVIASTRTDVGGRFQVSGESGRTYRLEARAPGFGPEVVLARRVGSETEIRLKQPASLEGVVRIGEEPAAFCPLVVTVSGQRVRLAEGRADASGRFRFQGLPATEVYVRAVPERRTGRGERATLVAGQESRVEIELPVGATLRGRVVDAVTKEPIEGVLVSPSWDYRFFARSQIDGRFEFEGVSGPLIVIYASKAGYASTAVNWTGRLDQECVIELSRGATVIGRVDDGLSGVPPGLEVVAGALFSTGPGTGSSDSVYALVNDDGSFALQDLRTDIAYHVVVRAPRYGRLRYALPGNLEPGQTFDMGQLSLGPPAALLGRVVDETGRPIAGAYVRLLGGNADMQRFLGEEAGSSSQAGLNDREVRSDQQGLFTIGELCAGSYTLTARSRRHAAAEKRTIEITSGLTAPPIEIVLHSVPSIRGVVRFQDGSRFRQSAHGSLTLSAKCASNNDWKMASVADGGEFEILGVTGDEYVLTSLGSPDGWVLPPQPKVRAGADQVVLMFETSSVLAGQVVGPDGTGMQAMVFFFYDDFPGLGGSPHSIEPDGRFELDVPSSFKGMVMAMHLTDQENQVRVKGVKAGTKDLRLQLR